MAWVACWTLPRSRPSQQLGEQGDVGRDLSLSSIPLVRPWAPFCSFLLILSHFSLVWGLPPPAICLVLLCCLR